jgi:hypothetical protein
MTIQIGSSEANFVDVSEGWIAQQLNARRSDGLSPCVRVKVTTPEVNIVLSTPVCPAGGGGRGPNQREQRIFDLWNERGLNRENIAPGQLVAFLHQLEHLV